jgi:hypothetical protein
MNGTVEISVIIEECEETDSGSEHRGGNPCPQILNSREGHRLRLPIGGVNYTLIINLVYPINYFRDHPAFLSKRSRKQKLVADILDNLQILASEWTLSPIMR